MLMREDSEKGAWEEGEGWSMLPLSPRETPSPSSTTHLVVAAARRGWWLRRSDAVVLLLPSLRRHERGKETWVVPRWWSLQVNRKKGGTNAFTSALSLPFPLLLFCFPRSAHIGFRTQKHMLDTYPSTHIYQREQVVKGKVERLQTASSHR